MCRSSSLRSYEACSASTIARRRRRTFGVSPPRPPHGHAASSPPRWQSSTGSRRMPMARADGSDRRAWRRLPYARPRAVLRRPRYGRPAVAAVSVDGARNAPTGDAGGPDGEVMLDIEVVGAVAPRARIAVYFAPNTSQGFLNAVLAAVHDDVRRPSVVSISWGAPRATGRGSRSKPWTAPFETAGCSVSRSARRRVTRALPTGSTTARHTSTSLRRARTSSHVAARGWSARAAGCGAKPCGAGLRQTGPPVAG